MTTLTETAQNFRIGHFADAVAARFVVIMLCLLVLVKVDQGVLL